MSQGASSNKDRPLSPHLLVYKPQLTSGLSILHRATGVGLAAGLVLVAVWLVAAATGEDAYNKVQGFVSSPVGMVLLLGWSVALFYHLCNGIRHLFWDLGYLFKIENAYKAGYFVLFLTILLTGVTWFAAMSKADMAAVPNPEAQAEQSCKQLCASYPETEKSFNGNRSCMELCVEEGPCSLPHVSCPSSLPEAEEVNR